MERDLERPSDDEWVRATWEGFRGDGDSRLDHDGNPLR